MVLSGGWRLFVGALVLLSAGVVAPATAHADPVACSSWDIVELPKPPNVNFSGMVAAAGSFAVGNGSFHHGDGSTVLIWKGGQLVDQLGFYRNPAYASDVNSSGTVILTAYLFPAASRWQDGVYAPLNGFPGEYNVVAIDVNERGDVLGTSNGKMVWWPAGSSTAQPVPGAAGSWTPKGIADDGSVVAANATGTYWIGVGGVVPLSPGAEVDVREVRGSHAVGTADGKVVRWNASGEASASYTEAAEAIGLNSHGHVLGRNSWDGKTSVWPDPEHYSSVWNTDAAFVSLTDEGDLYGTFGSRPNAQPLLLDCAGGTR